ncbi:MAG TPA: outer membrane beta-barrel protein [Pyrinomonadaceae bacterium]|jgi:opacity protein-like surface antigen
MRKLLLLIALIVACASVSFAQSSDDYNKVEFYGGYSHARVDTGVDDQDFRDFVGNTRGFNGFDTSITGNLSRYFGLKADFTAHFKNDSFTDTGITVNTKERIYNLLGGVQVKDNSKDARVKPFAHALAGFARQSSRFTAPLVTDTFEVKDTSFALKLGGGLDIRVSPKVDVRVIELDYNPIFLGDQTILGTTFQGQTQHNFTIGAGIVIH